MNDELMCPHCEKRLRYDFKEGRLHCPDCGYAPLDAVMAEKREAPPRQQVKLTHRGEVNHNAFAAFNTAHDLLHQGEIDKARESFKRAAYYQPGFVDVYLWLAHIAPDEATAREHLGTVIALDGSNPEALRRLLVLNGRLTSEQAERTYHHDDQQQRTVNEAVSTRTEALLCPQCSGTLTVNEDTGLVTCRFCGHSETRPAHRPIRDDLLSLALLERKAQPVRWVVGERLLHCNQCGAERTIPARKLSQECPFCGSNHVIVQDAVGSFEQPDGLVRFKVTRQQAAEQIKAALDGMMQRFASLFNNNRVKRASIEGVYLPFWVFDATANVTVTRTYQGSSRNANFVAKRRESRETLTDGLFDVAVSAVESPPAAELARLGKFDMSAAVPYEASLLAKYPAELYTVDFAKASLEARSVVSRIMRDKHGRKDTGDEQMRITVFSTVEQMSFRLLLLPVWVATLTEVDGDLRSALVNGQTGKVALGKTRRP